MRSCIMPRLPMLLVQELNAGTVFISLKRKILAEIYLSLVLGKF